MSRKLIQIISDSSLVESLSLFKLSSSQCIETSFFSFLYQSTFGILFLV